MKILTVMLILLILCASIIWIAKLQWQRYTTLQFDKLDLPASPPSNIDLNEINTLPPVVQKYFHLVLKKGSPLIKQVDLSQTGGFRAKPEMNTWSDMRARQRFTTSPKAFVWSAEIFMLQGIGINICDSYIKGQGSMKGKLLSLVPIINSQNEQKLTEAALQRYLAEAVWFPTALLPSQGVTWSKIDENRAKATITDHGIQVSVEFTFNEKGEIISVYTPQRYREVDGEYFPTPWSGIFSNYIEVDGFLVPSYAEARWILEEDIYSYWRADIIEIRFISQ